MPILYQRTDALVRHYGKKLKLAPDPFDLGSFATGLVVGYIVLPLVLPIVGIKLVQWAAPK